jgi:hypothetical protein
MDSSVDEKNTKLIIDPIAIQERPSQVSTDTHTVEAKIFDDPSCQTFTFNGKVSRYLLESDVLL